MTLFWYDLETFGRNPRLDRVAQFAGVRTDGDFEPIGDPLVLWCRITPDYLPNPQSCLITGIGPQDTLDKGVTEYELAKRVNAEFSKPGSCIVGFNNVRFDDEFVRSMLYRNFIDPYQWMFSRGNSRWDLMDPLRAAHDLRPEGMSWPEKEDGRPDFRLEGLARANKVAHDRAHDALSDVFATIALAKKLHDAQPKLFNFLFRQRGKEAVSRRIDLVKRTPFLHTSRMLCAQRGCTSIMAPLTMDPGRANRVICWDLRFDPELLLKLPVEELRRRLYTPRDELPDPAERVHLKGVHLNHCPVVAPLSTLDEPAARRLGLDVPACLARAELIKGDDSLIRKVRAVFEDCPPEGGDDPELQIYSGGFFKDEDKAVFEQIHAASAAGVTELNPSFRDPRLGELFFRFLGRNFPERLTAEQSRKWRSFCAGRILKSPAPEVMNLAEYDKRIQTILESREAGAREKVMARKLLDWGERLKKEVLGYP